MTLWHRSRERAVEERLEEEEWVLLLMQEEERRAVVVVSLRRRLHEAEASPPTRLPLAALAVCHHRIRSNSLPSRRPSTNKLPLRSYVFSRTCPPSMRGSTRWRRSFGRRETATAFPRPCPHPRRRCTAAAPIITSPGITA